MIIYAKKLEQKKLFLFSSLFLFFFLCFFVICNCNGRRSGRFFTVLVKSMTAMTLSENVFFYESLSTIISYQDLS